MPRPFVLCIVAMSGCAAHPLDEVPIDGATPEQAAAAGRAVSDFETWAGSGRVELHRIQFGAMNEGRAGRYGSGPREIRIADDLAASAVGEAVTHELCHALDRQEGLLDEPVAAFDDEIAVISAGDAHALHDNVADLPARDARSELFAEVCEQAPLRDAMLAEPCAGDSAEYAGVATFVDAHVWTASPDASVDDSYGLDPAVTWTADAPVTSLGMIGSESMNSVLIGAGSHAHYVSTVDGSDVDRFSDFTEPVIILGYEIPLPSGAPAVSFNIEQSPWVAAGDGEVGVHIVSDVHNAIDRTVLSPRVLVWRYHRPGWTVVAGACPGPQGNVFVARQSIFVGWPDGDEVDWAEADVAD